jgi:hypothetical protein
MSPNATLLAYSRSSAVKDIRDQAALVSMVWKEQAATVANQREVAKQPRESSQLANGSLETLTIEFATGTIIVKAIQPRLLLVLVGGVAPGTEESREFKITPERHNVDERYPPLPADDDMSAPPPRATELRATEVAGSVGSQTGGGAPSFSAISNASSNLTPEQWEEIKGGILNLQRRKIDAAVDHMREDFELKGFVMPQEGSVTV